jgi:hypothetical protein
MELIADHYAVVQLLPIILTDSWVFEPGRVRNPWVGIEHSACRVEVLALGYCCN